MVWNLTNWYQKLWRVENLINKAQRSDDKILYDVYQEMNVTLLSNYKKGSDICRANKVTWLKAILLIRTHNGLFGVPDYVSLNWHTSDP